MNITHIALIAIIFFSSAIVHKDVGAASKKEGEIHSFSDYDSSSSHSSIYRYSDYYSDRKEEEEEAEDLDDNYYYSDDYHKEEETTSSTGSENDTSDNGDNSIPSPRQETRKKPKAVLEGDSDEDEIDFDPVPDDDDNIAEEESSGSVNVDVLDDDDIGTYRLPRKEHSKHKHRSKKSSFQNRTVSKRKIAKRVRWFAPQTVYSSQYPHIDVPLFSKRNPHLNKRSKIFLHNLNLACKKNGPRQVASAKRHGSKKNFDKVTENFQVMFKIINGQPYYVRGRCVKASSVNYQEARIYGIRDFRRMRRRLGRPSKNHSNKNRYRFELLDTLSAAKKHLSKGKVAVLNFASEDKAGDGNLNGASAQEESLCRQSLLYLSLISKEARAFYRHHRRSMIIYSPNVLVIRDVDDNLLTEPWLVSSFSMAAPKKTQRISQDRNDGIIIRQLRNLAVLAAYLKFDVIIVGGYGCGVYDNDPFHVADSFYQVFEDEGYGSWFKDVVFAFTGVSMRDTFQNVFNDSKARPVLKFISPSYQGKSKSSKTKNSSNAGQKAKHHNHGGSSTTNGKYSSKDHDKEKKRKQSSDSKNKSKHGGKAKNSDSHRSKRSGNNGEHKHHHRRQHY